MKLFDSILLYISNTVREFHGYIAVELETCNTSNAHEFLKHINKLGPRKKKNIPFKVETEGGYTSEKEGVLAKLKTYFCSIYNVRGNLGFDDEFYNSINQEQIAIETNLSETNDLLNEQIS